MTKQFAPTGFAPDAAGMTHHLTQEAIWAAQMNASHYRPRGFEEEGFIHCTDGEENLLIVANTYYKEETGPFLVFDIDLSKASARAVYEDDQRIYPHIYGALDRDAIVRVRSVVRDADGTFLAVADDFCPG